MSIGIVSSGTLNADDLITAFSREIRSKLPRCADPDLRAYARKTLKGLESAEEDDKPACLDELFEVMEAFSPPYTYFAASEGDGAEFGYWPDVDSLREDARAKEGVALVSAGDPWPAGLKADGVRFVMEVNDHGNVALRYASNGKTVWDCV